MAGHVAKNRLDDELDGRAYAAAASGCLLPDTKLAAARAVSSRNSWLQREIVQCRRRSRLCIERHRRPSGGRFGETYESGHSVSNLFLLTAREVASSVLGDSAGASRLPIPVVRDNR